MRNDVEKKHNIISYFLITLLLAILLALSATATYLLLDTFRFVPPGGWNMRTPGVLLAFPRTYLVQSGSMEPAIKTGSIVITLPSSVYSQGEVITFSKNSKNIVTHRIQAKLYPEGASSSPVYKTAGDANENFDNWEVNNSDIIGKVVFSVPYVGYVADFAKKPQGFILLVIIPATIIIYEELKNIIRELKKTFKNLFNRFKGAIFKDSLPAQAGRTINFSEDEFEEKPLPKISILIPVFGTLLVFAGLAASYFLDQEKSVGNVFTASDTYDEVSPSPTLSPTPSISVTPSPTPTPGSGDVVINEINWAGNNSDSDDEWLELRNITSFPIDISGWKLEGAASGSTVITITSGVIPANGLFLLSNFSKTDSSSRLNIDPDIVTTTLQLDNTALLVTLKDISDVVIDVADDGVGVPLAGSNVAPKKSMERISPPGDGTQSTNWQTATTHTNMDGSGSTEEFGTPKATNGI